MKTRNVQKHEGIWYRGAPSRSKYPINMLFNLLTEDVFDHPYFGTKLVTFFGSVNLGDSKKKIKGRCKPIRFFFQFSSFRVGNVNTIHFLNGKYYVELTLCFLKLSSTNTPQ
jgi:hypothetical protein